MIVKDFYRTREDGVKLFINIDALIDENGEIIRNEKGLPIPCGFKILQNETGVKYPEAIDPENSKYTYTETDEPIPTEEENLDEITEKAKAYDILMGVEV